MSYIVYICEFITNFYVFFYFFVQPLHYINSIPTFILRISSHNCSLGTLLYAFSKTIKGMSILLFFYTICFSSILSDLLYPFYVCMTGFIHSRFFLPFNFC